MATRNHTIKITAQRWKDVVLREKVINDARQYAGSHPGVMVTIKRQSEYNTRAYEVVKRFINLSWEPREW